MYFMRATLYFRNIYLDYVEFYRRLTFFVFVLMIPAYRSYQFYEIFIVFNI
jgi:hypothetical protein